MGRDKGLEETADRSAGRFVAGSSVDVADLTVDAQRLWRGDSTWEAPLAFVHLDKANSGPDPIALPPFPVIGIGDCTHPLAPLLDAVIEPPISAELLMRQVLAAPQAAAVTVQLLRLLPSLEPEAALTAESFAYAVLQGSEEHACWRAANQQPVRHDEGRVAVAREGEALKITLDHPESGNAIDRAMRDQLFEAFSLAALDDGIALVDLSATGRAFSLGAELSEFGTITDPATAHAIRARTLPARAAWRCADRLEARVQGACVGAGLELAAWARRITATPGAWFQLPELAMGILPGAGGCVSLSRRIGRQRAALLILSGKRLNARQALDWCLVDAVMDEPA